MFAQDQVDKLAKIGSEWKKDDKFHRIYFNDLEERLGLDISYYKSGNVSGATQNGERISNSECKRILGRLAGVKIFYDVKAGDFKVQYGNLHDEEKERILDSIKDVVGL